MRLAVWGCACKVNLVVFGCGIQGTCFGVYGWQTGLRDLQGRWGGGFVGRGLKVCQIDGCLGLVFKG